MKYRKSGHVKTIVLCFGYFKLEGPRSGHVVATDYVMKSFIIYQKIYTFA